MSALMRNVLVCDHGKCEEVVAGRVIETVTQLRGRAEVKLHWRTRVSVPADFCPDHAWRDPRPGERWRLAVAGPLTSKDTYMAYTYRRWVADGIWRYVPDNGGTPILPEDPSIYGGYLRIEVGNA